MWGLVAGTTNHVVRGLALFIHPQPPRRAEGPWIELLPTACGLLSLT